jgi:hypothetical protein
MRSTGGRRPAGAQHANGLYQAGTSAALASNHLRVGNPADAVAQARIAYRYLHEFLLEFGDEEDLNTPCD